jgi:hypothetical protein
MMSGMPKWEALRVYRRYNIVDGEVITEAR